jgi:hypothetical protein
MPFKVHEVRPMTPLHVNVARASASGLVGILTQHHDPDEDHLAAFP